MSFRASLASQCRVRWLLNSLRLGEPSVHSPDSDGHIDTCLPAPFSSDTTRSPRAGEENGVAYHFTDRSGFKTLIEQSAFIEHAEFSGNCYGTSAKAVADFEGSGKRCLLDIDTQVSRYSI